MKIIGIGVDIVDIDWVENFFLNEKLLKRIFTERELISSSRRADRWQHLGGKYAAKEAVLKSIKISRDTGFLFTEIEITNQENGEPVCSVKGKVKEILEKNGGKNAMISISHSKKSAVAVCICTGS